MPGLDPDYKFPKGYSIIIMGMATGKKYFCATPPIGCGKEVIGFKDRISAQEYKIQQLCQDCQDEIFDTFKEGD